MASADPEHARDCDHVSRPVPRDDGSERRLTVPAFGGELVVHCDLERRARLADGRDDCDVIELGVAVRLSCERHREDTFRSAEASALPFRGVPACRSRPAGCTRRCRRGGRRGSSSARVRRARGGPRRGLDRGRPRRTGRRPDTAEDRRRPGGKHGRIVGDRSITSPDEPRGKVRDDDGRPRAIGDADGERSASSRNSAPMTVAQARTASQAFCR